jgi:hypothetical protein
MCHCRDSGRTQRRTRVTGVLLPLRPKLFDDLQKGGAGYSLDRKASIVDDEKKLPLLGTGLGHSQNQNRPLITDHLAHDTFVVAIPSLKTIGFMVWGERNGAGGYVRTHGAEPPR